MVKHSGSSRKIVKLRTEKVL
jgi:hypothetical protein